MTTVDHLRVFGQALAQDRELVAEMCTILGRAQAINVDFRDAARRRLQTRVRLLVRSIDRERWLLDEVDIYNVEDLTLAREIAFSVEGSLVRARAAALAFDRALETNSIIDLTREPELAVLVSVVQALDDSAAAVVALVELCAKVAENEGLSCASKRHSPLWASRRVANFAVRLLPWEERQRYLDEYVSELDDLAQTENISRYAQLKYALRLLVRAPALRVALRATAPQDSQLQGRAMSRLTGLITSRPDA